MMLSIFSYTPWLLVCLLWRHIYSSALFIFKLVYLSLLWLSNKTSLYILVTSCVADMWFANCPPVLRAISSLAVLFSARIPVAASWLTMVSELAATPWSGSESLSWRLILEPPPLALPTVFINTWFLVLNPFQLKNRVFSLPCDWPLTQK